MDHIGKSPIPLPFLITGKLATLGCIIFFFIKEVPAVPVLYSTSLTNLLGGILTGFGIVILAAGFVCLGRSVAVGFPDEKTELKTNGIYHYCRNPMYLGGYLICLGSCLYYMTPLNFLFCGIAIGIHHWIVTREEKFLQVRFGSKWEEYKKHTARYI